MRSMVGEPQARAHETGRSPADRRLVRIGGRRGQGAGADPASDPAARFARTAARLERLAEGHPMQGWLGFMADVSAAQSAVAASLPPFASQTTRKFRSRSRRASRRSPPTAGGATRSGATASSAASRSFRPGPCAARRGGGDRRAARPPRRARPRRWPTPFCAGGLDPADAGAAFWIAAALQVYFTRLAAGFPRARCDCCEQRGLCPCCGSTPSAGVVRASGQNARGALSSLLALLDGVEPYARGLHHLRGLAHAGAARDRRRSRRGQGRDLRRVPDLREGAV